MYNMWIEVIIVIIREYMLYDICKSKKIELCLIMNG